MAQVSDGEFIVERSALQVPGRAARTPVAYMIATFCLYGLAYWFAYRFGMSFSHVTASPFWFPDSVLLCALLFTPTRLWWVFLLGALPIRIALPETAGIPLWFLLTTYAIDSAKAVLAASALRHFLCDPLRLRTVRDYVLYCLIAVLLVPAAAAVAGASARFMLGYDYWASWQQWFMGNALAHLVVTPAILYGIPGAARMLADLRPRRLIEASIVAAGLAVTGYTAFLGTSGAMGFAETRFYMPVPFMFWAALRFGLAGASGAVVLISIIAVDAALDGRGPFAGGSPDEIALALQHFLLLRAAPLYLVAILIEQKQMAEDGLVASERRYREVVESQSELVCRFLPNGTLSFVNGAFCRTFERHREVLLGMDFVTLLPESVHELARTQIGRAALREERGEWECQVVRPDGTAGWRYWLCHPVIAPGGDMIEFQAIGQDITDRKRAEQADRELAHASRLAMAGELTAMVAHEINQPLAAILSNAEAAGMLLDSKDPPLGEIRQILLDIRRSDLRASDIILGLRALLGKHEFSRQPIDLDAAIADVLRILRADLQNRQIRVRSDFAASLPPVSADRVQLEQILLNLFVNAMDAMQATPRASRLITVSTRHAASDAIEVVVADCGHGIAPERLTSIFDSFYSTKHNGMGLGLSIARSIVQSQQGRIWAENTPEGGAAFHFTLKLAEARVE